MKKLRLVVSICMMGLLALAGCGAQPDNSFAQRAVLPMMLCRS